MRLFVPALLLPLVYANAFVGCVSQSSVTTYDQITSAAIVSSASACATFCANSALIPSNTPTPYSYYRQSGTRCLCSPDPPGPSGYAPSSTSGPADVCIDTSLQSVFRLRTTFTFVDCYGGSAITSTAPTVSSLNECFARCRYTSGVLFSALSGGFQCQCGAESRTASTFPYFCSDGPGRFFFYTHPFPDASAGNPRRRRQKAIHHEGHCPAGLTACKIGGTEGYECIDTATELESCGGCIHGRFGRVKPGPIGVNCIGGEDSMTCSRGQCVKAFQERRQE